MVGWPVGLMLLGHPAGALFPGSVLLNSVLVSTVVTFFFAQYFGAKARQVQAERRALAAPAADDAPLAAVLQRLLPGAAAAPLDPDQFWQVHRSTIVNLRHAAGTRRDELSRLFVRLHGHAAELPVSRAYVHLFKAM